jgi:hypothetical protein
MFLWQKIHTTGEYPLRVAFYNHALKKLYKEKCQDPEPELNKDQTH